MTEKTYQTPLGTIHYWVSIPDPEKVTLVFLPGLTADHRLFRKQIEAFEGKYNLFVWDAPGHNKSWPFRLEFSLMDKARWLQEILEENGVQKPILVGQSMGGYLGQAFAQAYPDYIAGFVSIDSAPLQRKFYTGWELWLLKRMEPVYRHYPWKSLLKSGCNGVAVSDYGRALMREMMMTYQGDQRRYAQLTGHGYRILAEAVEKDLPYGISCPAQLICGKQDRAGSCVRYNKGWHKQTGIPIAWLDQCGHNANTDQPDQVNQLIEDLVQRVN
ncbi:MAG: alpha/beta hydrolase [Ruminiclostridium sp.]|nr:alpha/beta hydrolase [Ruminiclostridium sp.]